ncbi:RNA polymerase sigma factor [Paenibacillus sp. CAU 1782]
MIINNNFDGKGYEIKQFYCDYYQVMYNTAYSVLMDHYEAEDVVHNAIIKLADHMDTVCGTTGKRTKSYIIVTVRNLSIDIYNKKKRFDFLTSEDENNLPSCELVDIDEILLKANESVILEKKIYQLYPPYHDVLILKYFHDCSLTEIAAALDTTKNNASVRIHRALASLKNIYKIEGND